MANRYWVGGTGNWSDATNHWSDVSGGSPNASFLPTSADNVYFDANSFSTTGRVVTVDGIANCADIDWTNVTNSPTFTGTSTKTINIYGSMIYAAGMSDSYAGTINFVATSTGKTITTANKWKSLGTFAVSFTGNGGGWTLQDDISTSASISISAGTFNTGNKNITCKQFSVTGTSNKTLNLGTSTISPFDNVTISATNTTFNATQSTIKMTGNTKTFTGNGLTFGTVELTGTPITIATNTTIGTLKLTANTTIKFTAGTTQTITNWSGDGTLGNIITIQSTSAGTFYTINCTSGTITKNYYSIQDCHVDGGAIFKAYLSTDVSGNAGWDTISANAQPTGTATKNLRMPNRKIGKQFRYVR